MHQITRETMKTRRASLPILQHRVGFSRENTCSSLSLFLFLHTVEFQSHAEQLNNGTGSVSSTVQLLEPDDAAAKLPKISRMLPAFRGSRSDL